MSPADRGLNDPSNQVREALSFLLSPAGKITEKVHQEVLRLVFCPATDFDGPILDFANPGLARLVKFGQSVVWETPECAKGQARSVVKPMNNVDQEALLEFSGMSLHNINICLSLY